MEAPLPALIEPCAADLDGLQALSLSAHWNQNRDDWAWMLAHGRARALRVGGQIIASTLVLPWEPSDSPPPPIGGEPSVAWISMVLVLPGHRGQGYASRLLRDSLEWLEEPPRRHLLPVLDATPAGRSVYLRQGFSDCWGFARWGHREHRARPSADPSFAIIELGRTQPTDQVRGQLLALDRVAFGGCRATLIDELIRRSPEIALAAATGSQIDGFVLARPGRVASQIGPLIARNAQCARALLAQALARLSGPVFIDVPDACHGLAVDLGARGFTVERPFTRMALYRSPVKPSASLGRPGSGDPATSDRPAIGARAGQCIPGDSGLIWAVAGPELG